MTAKAKRRSTDFTLDAQKRSLEFRSIPEQDAIHQIQFSRKNSINPEYWDLVERYVREYHRSRAEAERRTDDFYIDQILPHQRERAEQIAADLMGDCEHAFNEVNSHIDSANTSAKRYFWMYVKRILTKHFYGGA